MKKLIKGLTTLVGIIALTGMLVIKDVQITKYGTQVIFRDNTGYYIEK